MRYFTKNKKGFSLIELMIVVGLTSIVGLYISKMITDMQGHMRNLEAKNDEFEFRYITQMLFTNSNACKRTIGEHCEENEYLTKDECDTNVGTGNWNEAFITLVENDQEKLNIYTLDSSNYIQVGHNTAREGKIINANGHVIYQTCEQIELTLGVEPIDLNLLNNIENPFARLILAIIFSAINEAINQCNKAVIGRNIALTRLSIANYPLDEGGVPINPSSGGEDQNGRIAFIVEYIRTDRDPWIAKKQKLDLLVKTNSDNQITKCISSNEPSYENYSIDKTKETGMTITTLNEPSNVGKYQAECSSGDELVSYNVHRITTMPSSTFSTTSPSFTPGTTTIPNTLCEQMHNDNEPQGIRCYDLGNSGAPTIDKLTINCKRFKNY